MAQAKKKGKAKNRWLMFVISFLVLLMFSVIGGYFALMYAGGQMIDMQKIADIKLEASELYDKNGTKIANLYVKENNRTYVKYTEIPQHVIDAFIAVEDRRFFDHNGIDMVRIGGAIIKDITHGELVEGGSTITQQLAKNVFLSNEQTFWRKTKEMSIAINLEQKYSKQEIMEMYLNKIYLGHGVFGVQNAAQLYFGKNDIKKVTLEEAAMLAAIIKAPSHYSPFLKPDKAKERRDTILRLMMEQGFITQEQKEAAQKQPIPTKKTKLDGAIPAGYESYVDYVVGEAEEKYDISEEMLYRGGWKIYTTFDPKVQDAMVTAFKNDKLFPKKGPKQIVEAGMVVMDKTGGVAAIMGGRNYSHKGFSHAVGMTRQPGSAFKPLAVYAPAFEEKDYNANSTLPNNKQDFNGYKPNNWNGKYSDSVSLKYAMEQSLNIPAVWLLNEIGIGKGIDYVNKFGIQLDKEDRNLSIALGGLSKGTSPLKMAQAYTAFANGGVMSEAHAITKITDDRDNTVGTAQLKQTTVISAKTAWDIHNLLVAVVKNGTGKAAQMDRPVAGKTGTTQSQHGSSKANLDAWFVGYTPEYVGAVWMGFDKEDKQHLMYDGSSKTAKLFREVLNKGLKGMKVTSFQPPAGIEEKKQEEEKPITLDAVLAMENSEPKVVLSWSGAEGQDLTYDVYRFTDSPDNKEMLLAGTKETTFVDPVQGAVLYKYVVMARKADGSEGQISNVANVDISTLEQMLQDSENLHQEGTEDQPDQGNGEIPPPDIPSDNTGGTPEDGLNPDGNGQDGSNQGGSDPNNGQNPDGGQTTPNPDDAGETPPPGIDLPVVPLPDQPTNN
ncbi:PBP1A family penicillin-binding protein [Brevibacillus sp. SYSU BS000544]|uniref:PBP1A family penicillin-binding protein n=1 Tax=Brevibacillus sp. SYSU BS000544 TaxID=3416443 RepID=UPI003CE4EF01